MNAYFYDSKMEQIIEVELIINNEGYYMGYKWSIHKVLYPTPSKELPSELFLHKQACIEAKIKELQSMRDKQ